MTGTVKLSQLPTAGDVIDLTCLMTNMIPVKMMTNDDIEIDMQGERHLDIILLLMLSVKLSKYFPFFFCL